MVIYLPSQSVDEEPLLDELTPREIVRELDKHVVDRPRPSALWPSPCATDPPPETGTRDGRGVMPEHPHDRPHRRGQDRTRPPPGAARNSPFLKVEASKFTEVGYVGATWSR